MTRRWGIRPNAQQFGLQLLQVFQVGLTLGMTRTVIPVMAEADFGVPQGSFLLLTSFVVAFGLVKAGMNFLAGHLSERYGRRTVLEWGWWLALPMPWMMGFASSWGWVVAATVLLGVNQGLTWSMTQTAQLDLTRPEERGLTLGLNEFAGYAGVALAGMATASLAATWGVRPALMLFGGLTTVSALLLARYAVHETLPWARSLTTLAAAATPQVMLSTRAVFWRMSGGDLRLMALSQAGLVEKFVDALVWVFVPVYLHREGLTLPEVGGVTGVYGLVWGVAQLGTGRLSDRLGRHGLNVGGMWLCGAGVVAGIGRSHRLGHGLAVPQSVGRRGGLGRPGVAGQRHWHLPLLARPGLRCGRAAVGWGGALLGPTGAGVLGRGGCHGCIRCLLAGLWGRKPPGLGAPGAGTVSGSRP